ncbi:hypothetical protein ACWEO4_25880 [Streptomyces sp. NPDC004393]|uniref:hypothetical protein n=1 Tax=Streptomyces sp. NPDC004533 TaxID=3154278 RepID=UPI0033A64889
MTSTDQAAMTSTDQEDVDTDQENVDTGQEDADGDQTGLSAETEELRDSEKRGEAEKLGERAEPEEPEELGDPEELEERHQALSPRQARRIRIAVAGAIMAAVAVMLVIGLREQPSLLTIGVYGATLVLCGAVIELSRRGRTRIGTWLLATGLVAVVAADQFLRAR